MDAAFFRLFYRFNFFYAVHGLAAGRGLILWAMNEKKLRKKANLWIATAANELNEIRRRWRLTSNRQFARAVGMNERTIAKLNPKQPKNHQANLKELLTADQWNIVTIQQGSHESWNKEKFQPAANELIAYIRKNAPQAEIVVHQTWSYRNSDGRISGPKPGWGFDQNGMYDRLTANYTNLAKEHKLRVIPVGKAVQLFREKTPVKYTPPTAEEKKNLVCPDLPKRAGDVVGNDWWAKDKKTGEMVLKSDSIHLNNDGNYLQGCVWYGFLFGEDPASIQFVPRNIGNKQAALLRTCASEALKSFPQVKK